MRPVHYAARLTSPQGNCTLYLQDPLPRPDLPSTGKNPSTKILGGNLNSLKQYYHCIDFLEDAEYTAQNAAITAHCAVKLLYRLLPLLLQGLSG